MLKAAGNAIAMEKAVKKLLFENRIQSLSCEKASRPWIRIPFFQLSSLAVIKKSSSQTASKHRDSMKVYAMRRRRSNIETDTYVLMEPGKNEEFVTKDELRDRLKGWLENWPGKSLPPDLARFEDINDAVSYLVKSVCELEIDGDVGSIQWFEVRLE
ncbi:hypothetical protein ACSBR2_022811 [Camellia fascicularis]